MLSAENKIQFLQDVYTFRSLSSEQISVLADLCETRIFRVGSFIFRQGDLDESIYIVVDGRVGIEREIKNSFSTVSLPAIRPQQYFGEMSLFYHAPRSVSATALADTVVLEIHRDAFVDFVGQYPDLLVEFNYVLSQRLAEAYDTISEIFPSQKPRELQRLYEKLDF